MLIGVFLIMALQNLGVELLPLIAGMGVAGAGIALDALSLEQCHRRIDHHLHEPYRVGEYIAVVAVEGAVDAISLFRTVLTHTDRSRIVVPNRKVVGEILQNFGHIRQSEADYSAISVEINRSVAEDLRRRGIVMPSPQREVRLRRSAA